MFEEDTTLEDSDLEGYEVLPFTKDIKHGIIHLMIKSPDFGKVCSYYLKPSYFGNHHLSWFVKFIQKYNENYGQLPSVTVIKNEILKHKEEDRLEYVRVFKKILDSDITHPEYIQDGLNKFIKESVFRTHFEKVRDAFAYSDSDEAVIKIQDLIAEHTAVDFRKELVFKFSQFWDIAEEMSESKKHRLPLGIPPFDEVLLGGIARKQLLLWLGGTNVGKSVILINCMVNFVKNKKKVLYVDLENDPSEVILRVMSCLTGIHYNALNRAYSLSAADRKKIAEAQKLLDEYVEIKIWQDYSTKVEDVIAWAEHKKEEFQYDALIIDYLQILKTKEKYDSKYNEHGESARMLSLMAKKNDIVVITAAQGNRDAQKKQKNAKRKDALLSITDISDSFEIIRKSDVVITITRSKSHEENNEIIYLLDKQRRGRTQIAVKFHTNFDALRVFGDDMKYELYGDDDVAKLEKYELS